MLNLLPTRSPRSQSAARFAALLAGNVAACAPATAPPAEAPSAVAMVPSAHAVTAAPPPVAPPSPSPAPATCEAAIDGAQEMTRTDGTREMTRGQHAAILNRGDYVMACGAPISMTVSVCVAIRAGRAIGVTVRTTPENATIASCVDKAVRGMSFPSHDELDLTRTVFQGI